MSDILPDRTKRLTEDESNDLACDWSDYRKDYGISPDPHISSMEHLAFKAGWAAHRNIPTARTQVARDLDALLMRVADGDATYAEFVDAVADYVTTLKEKP